MELIVLDAASQLSMIREGAEALASHPSTLLTSLTSKALNRAANPDLRLAALHALATIAGKLCVTLLWHGMRADCIA